MYGRGRGGWGRGYGGGYRRGWGGGWGGGYRRGWGGWGGGWGWRRPFWGPGWGWGRPGGCWYVLLLLGIFGLGTMFAAASVVHLI